MKKNSENLFTKMNNNQVKNLTAIADETIAYNHKTNNKIFTAADLWNIQRQQKSKIQRRLQG